MLKKFLLVTAVSAAFSAAAQYSDPYKVIVPLSAEDNGSIAKIIDYDTSEGVDSVVVADGAAIFRGTLDEPFAARVLAGGGRSPLFILEEGTIAFSNDGRKAFGSPLNDKLNVIVDSLALNQGNEIEYLTRVMNENLDNPIGYVIFLELAYEMEPQQLEDFISKNPDLGKYTRVKRLIENNRRKAASGIGAKYLDFDIDGQRLSDYVGKDGKYLLVDFFASWCGPCVKQLPVLKELYKTYADKLNVLGVAVWDEPEDSKRAIEQHELTWPCIIGAGTVPTDLYGISGIPCIMLISPDGTILSRDLQGDELKAAVANALK